MTINIEIIRWRTRSWFINWYDYVFKIYFSNKNCRIRYRRLTTIVPKLSIIYVSHFTTKIIYPQCFCLVRIDDKDRTSVTVEGARLQCSFFYHTVNQVHFMHSKSLILLAPHLWHEKRQNYQCSSWPMILFQILTLPMHYAWSEKKWYSTL